MTDAPRRAAFVTGAGSGIGRATALRFAASGAAVALVDIDAEAAHEVAAEVTTSGGEAMALTADIAAEDAAPRTIAATVAAFGRLDWAVNNAGVTGGSAGPDDWDEAIMARAMAINVTGTWRCMKHQVDQMLRQRGGAIVNIASIAGLVGVGGFAYTTTKHAIVGLTKIAGARYAARGIRINAVCPGTIATPMLDRAEARTPGIVAGLIATHPIARLGTPSEIAEAVFWLCSDQASFIVGQAIAVDGGFTVV